MNIGEKDLPCGAQDECRCAKIISRLLSTPLHAPLAAGVYPLNSRREHYPKLSVLPSGRITQDLHGEESAFDASRGKNQRLLTPQLHVACAVRPALPGDVPRSPKRALG